MAVERDRRRCAGRVRYPSVGAQEPHPQPRPRRSCSGKRDRLTRPDRRAEREALKQIYGVPTPRALWMNPDGRPTSQALAMMDLLAALLAVPRSRSPSDYEVETLRIWRSPPPPTRLSTPRGSMSRFRAPSRRLIRPAHGSRRSDVDPAGFPQS